MLGLSSLVDFSSLWLQVLQISNSYRELEKKYEVLTSLVHNQSQLMTQLEKQCQVSTPIKPQQVRGFSVSVYYTVIISPVKLQTRTDSDRLFGAG